MRNAEINSKNYGIICIILSAFSFACMNLFIKLAGDIPTFEKCFFRNIIAFFFALAIIIKKKEKLNINKNTIFPLVMRAVGGTMGLLCNFYAIDHLLIADASMINKLSPFFVLIFSYLILKEKVKLYQWICIAIAFIGSLFVIKPSGELLHNPASLVGILGGIGAGFAYAFVRIAGKRGVKGPVIIAFFSGFSTLVTIPLMLMDFKPLGVSNLVFLLLAGLAATGGQFGITAAYTFAPAREVSIYDYSQVIFATILGVLFLSEIPDMYSFIGYAVIIAASLVMFILNNRKKISTDKE